MLEAAADVAPLVLPFPSCECPRCLRSISSGNLSSDHERTAREIDLDDDREARRFAALSEDEQDEERQLAYHEERGLGSVWGAL